MEQEDFLLNLLGQNPNAIIVGSLGSIAYDLKKISHKHKILIAGAMGAALGVGLGYALSSKKKVIVVIGDGAFLMKMGAMADILRYNLKNLTIYVMNNNQYKSTGGQPTNFKYLSRNPTMFKVVNLKS